MVSHVDGWWGRHIDDVSHPCHAGASQPEVTVGAGHDPMLHDLGGRRSGAAMGVLSSTCFARLFLFGWRLFRLRFHTRGFWRFPLFSFCEMGQHHMELLQGLAELFQRVALAFSQRLMFRPPLSDFFLSCHGFSVSKRLRLNSYLALTTPQMGDYQRGRLLNISEEKCSRTLHVNRNYSSSDILTNQKQEYRFLQERLRRVSPQNRLFCAKPLQRRV
jgi:hypothetical protein